MDIRLVTYNDELVTPLNDALIYEKAVPNNGIFYGYDFAISGNTVISMEGGKGLLYGREFESGGGDIEIQLSSSGVLKGRLYLHMDLANISEPIQILSQVETTLPALIDNPNVNRENGVTELELCTFDVGTTEITNLVKTVPTIQNTVSSNATDSSAGLMSAADKAKLDGIETGANKYSLPTASSGTLGGIKVGSNLSISNGVLSAKDTTYSTATTSANGLLKQLSNNAKQFMNGSGNWTIPLANLYVTYSEYTTASLTAKTDNTITVTKPSAVTGTVLACIPVGSGARCTTKDTFLNLSAPLSSTITNLRAGKFNGQTIGGTTKQTYTCAVLWVWY